MIKITQIRFLSNLVSTCICILNYAYTCLKPCMCILNDAYASFSTNSKSHILIDLIKERYSMWDQISMLETLNTKLI